MLMLAFVIFALLTAIKAQKAILLTSSLGFYNYRQNSNIVKIYHHLKSNNFLDQDILLLFGELQPCCEKNPKFGTLSFYDGDYGNIFKEMEIDYYQSELTDDSVANILSQQYPKHALNKRKINVLGQQELFIYITGHGGDFYFKIRERMALIDEQFMNLFEHLAHKNLTNSIALLSDSCSAITPFQTIKIDNFLALASSSYDEKSQSHGNDKYLHGPKADDFTFYFDQFLKTDNYLKAMTFNDLLKYMDFSKLKVNSKMVRNNFNPNRKIDDFIKKPRQLRFIKKKPGCKTFKQILLAKKVY